MKKAHFTIAKRIVIICAGLMFFLYLNTVHVSAEESQKNLTLMIYLCGSDLETQYGSATEDLQEIVQACEKNPQVTVLAMAGGSTNWKAGSIGPGETVILEISSGGRQRILEHYGKMNMGDPDTLSAFLRYGAEKRPASQYALILWDHGGGPMEGVCFDECQGMDSLSLSELSEALKNSPFAAGGLAWIGFDACLMASVETARCCEQFAEYMIASQETEPGSGWNYAFLKDIQPGETAEETCRRIVSIYMEGKKESDMLTISMVDLDRISDLEHVLNSFFQKISDYLTEDSFSDLSRSRLNTKSFGRASTGSDYDLADLYHLSESYAFVAPEEAKVLQKRLKDCVVSNAGNQENAFGLSVYYPSYNRRRFIEKWQDEYRKLGFLSSYRTFLNRYCAIWMEEPMISWAHLTGFAGPLTEQKTQKLELKLTDEQVEHFAEATCQILEEHGAEGLYYNIYTVPQTMLESNMLTAEYDFQALYAVDDQGVIETAPIPFIIRDGYYIVYAHLTERSWITGDSGQSMTIMMQCRKNEANQELEIINILPMNEEDQIHLGRQSITIDTDRWKFIYLNALLPNEATKDRDGSLLPFDQWETAPSNLHTFDINYIDRDGNRINWMDSAFSYQEKSVPDGAHQKFEADLTRSWKLKFMPVITNGKTLFAQFTVRDTQGNEWGSDLIQLTAADAISSSPISCEPIEVEGCRIQPVEIKAIRNDQFKGLCVRLRITSESEESLFMYAVDPEINGMVSPKALVVTDQIIPPGWDGTVDVLIDLDSLPYLKDSVIRHVSFLPVMTFMYKEKDGFFPAPSGRLEIETELDITGMDMEHIEAADTPLGSCELHGVTVDLIRLEETENGNLCGTIHFKNGSEGSRRFKFVREQSDDTYAVFSLNDLLLTDCVDVQSLLCLQPGSEGYYDFQLISGENRKIQVRSEEKQGEEDDPVSKETEKPRIWERRIKQILICGFSVTVWENVMSTISASDDEAPAEWIRFAMNRPYFLRNQFDVVFHQAESAQ